MRIGDNMKKGFTLVELLAVVTIMGVILLISVPNITKQLKKTNSNRYSEFVEDLFLATESYLVEHNNSIDLSNGEKSISVEKLVKSGYFKSTTINPKTNKKVNLESYVIASLNSDNTYKFKYIDSQINICSIQNEIEDGNHVYYCDPGDGSTRRFYLINENSDEIVLLLDRNIGEFTEYESSLLYLEDNTKNWYNVVVRMPSGSDIMTVLNNNTWSYNSDNISINSSVLNSNTSCYMNLCTEKINNKKNDSLVLGYWVNTDLNDNAWVINNNEFKKVFKKENGYGVRPIIIVKK